MKDKKKWPLEVAMPIAEKLYSEFEPHCKRIYTVGSINRGKSEVSDIDIICIAKQFQWGVFKGLENDLATVVDKYKKIKGEMDGKTKYVRRETPEGICFDLWICNESNWGLLINTKTGPVKYNVRTIIPGLKAKGYKMADNHVICISTGKIIPVKEEQDLYKLMCIPHKDSKDRK